MSTNKSFWKRWLEGKQDKVPDDDKAEASASSEDSLEEGLKGLSLIESGKAVVSRFRRKTQSLGEEIGNSITHGVMAIFMLGILPYAAIRAYNRAPEGQEALDAFGTSVFVISVFLMFLSSTIYHSMARATKHKAVMNRIDHIMIFFAIAGTYTPICLSVIGGSWGLGLCIAQWALVIAGTLFKALAFSKSIRSYVFTIAIYLLMGWMVLLCLPLLKETASAATFWLIVAGGFCYTAGIVSFALKFKFSHMVWHFLVDFGAICHLLAIVFFLR
ncbi:MAG: hemolysin III family protein [Clostridiaceae bacterium]|jgi:hemolysin III|nr:hemolysin III family protein [Oscillospiraceae bacterium]NLO63144.1 hemolysin III family protein [Clostridiaceae bacterium]